MGSGYYLEDVDHSEPLQYRAPRREDPSGVVVVHTAENTPDHVGFDGGAEAVASWIARRTDYGSYHTLADSDSILSLVAPWNEAFHDATGSNRHSFGVSAATRADIWPLAPKAWRDGCIHNMAVGTAVYAMWLRDTRGILIPARRITRAQSEDRIPGFISHAERDPNRRTDPGRFFPWDQFLSEYRHLVNPPTQMEEDMPWFMVASGRIVRLVIGDNAIAFPSNERLSEVRAEHKRVFGSERVVHYSPANYDLILSRLNHD